MLGKIEGGRRREQQKMKWLDGTTDSVDPSLSKFSKTATGKPGVLQYMGSQKSQTRLNNNTHVRSKRRDNETNDRMDIEARMMVVAVLENREMRVLKHN